MVVANVPRARWQSSKHQRLLSSMHRDILSRGEVAIRVALAMNDTIAAICKHVDGCRVEHLRTSRQKRDSPSSSQLEIILGCSIWSFQIKGFGAIGAIFANPDYFLIQLKKIWLHVTTL
jgi:hypothetical protein